MNIGIIVAMQKELNLLLPLISNTTTQTNDGYTTFSGMAGPNEITVMQCGIGKVNAAIGTVSLLNNFDLDLVINTGVAGGADKSVNIMDIIVGEEVAYHDVWCGPGTVYGEASGYPLYYKSDNGITKLIKETGNTRIKTGLICSGDKFIADIEEINFIKKKFSNALAVDMESASIAQVCCLRNVPFFCIRIISDSPGANKDNIAQYENFWDEAPKQTFGIIKDLLQKI